MEWNEPLYPESPAPNGQTGVLVLHGFTGSPRSLQELAARLVDAGYSVALPLLTGHGLTPENMETARWTDWTADVERAFNWLKDRTDRVFVTGLSMGGTLCLWLAEQHPEIAGVVTVNALYRHPQELLMCVVGKVGLPRWLKAVGNDIKCPGADEMAYSRLPSRAARQLALLLAAVRRDIAAVRCPPLVFSAVNDHVVPPANQEEIYDSIGSDDKKLVLLDNSYHVATMDNDKEQIFAETLAFVAAHSAG